MNGNYKDTKRIQKFAWVLPVLMMVIMGAVCIYSTFFAGYNSADVEENGSNINDVLPEGMQMSTDSLEALVWQVKGVAQKLPAPTQQYGKILEENDTKISFELLLDATDDFDAYRDACKEKGFIVNAYETKSWYEAYDSDGNYLTLSITQKEYLFMRVQLKASL